MPPNVIAASTMLGITMNATRRPPTMSARFMALFQLARMERSA